MSLAAIVLCSAFIVNVSGAAAYYSSLGSGSGATQAANIAGPSGITVSQAGTTVTVNWSAAILTSGVGVQGYEVTRSDGTAICGSPTPVTTLSCTDSNPSPGTYTYTVEAVYNSWDQSATSASFTILTTPTITAKPANPSNSASASFSFSGGNGSSYQCRLDGGAYVPCTSPEAYGSLGEGSHTFTLKAADASSTGPTTSYTWTVDTTAPTQSLALGSGASRAYLSGTTLYYRGSAAGSFKLIDTVADSGSGPASATYPSIATTGWTHAGETVTTPSGGPYTSSTFSWTANPSAPAGYAVGASDVAGNTGTTSVTFVSDTTVPTGAALTVNGTPATAAGSTSQASNSTSFTIDSRSDYTDSGSGLQSSILTVQSETLSIAGTCGASAGPFATATTVTGTTQPAGIVAGYCYVYTLTGTDQVGNTASLSTTVIDNQVTFKVTTQPLTATAGIATPVVLTAIKNGVPDTSYTGAALTWSGADNTSSGTAPTLPTSPTWIAGVATFTVTLVDVETATLAVTDGTRSVSFSPIAVSAGIPSHIAWTSPSSSVAPPSPCLFTCAYGSGFGSGTAWSASVSITDSEGNIINNLGTAQTVTISVTGTISTGKGTVTPASVTIPAAGPATSSVQMQYTSRAQGNYADTVTAADTGYTSATASFSR